MDVSLEASLIDEAARECARCLKSSEKEMIEILQVVNEKKVYREFGFASLYKYAVDRLHLEEGKVYGYNAVAKKCAEIPELKEAISSGELNVDKARRFVSALTPENQAELIPFAITAPQKLLEREVVRINPKASIPDKIAPVAENLDRMTVTVSPEIAEKIKAIVEFLSQKNKKACTLADAMEYMAALALEKLDPVKKARRNINRKPIFSLSRKSPRFKPAAIRHAVTLRDGGACTFPGCGQRRWTDMHHIKLVSEGGESTVENLTTLCSGHHRLLHSQKHFEAGISP